MFDTFHKNILNVPHCEYRENPDWWEFDIPDIIPEVPDKYEWMMYIGGNYDMFVFFQEFMVFDDHFGEEGVSLEDEEIEFCL